MPEQEESLAPPSYSEVLKDPRWKEADPRKKNEVLNKWSLSVQDYAKKNNLPFDPEKHQLYIDGAKQSIMMDEDEKTNGSQFPVQVLPLHGAVERFKESDKGGTELLGDNLAGQALGKFAGSGAALGTIFNPVAEGLGGISRLGHGAIQGLAGNPNAEDIVSGKADPTPFYQPEPSESATVNFLRDLGKQAISDPLNTAAMVYGGVKGLSKPKAASAPIERGVSELKTGIGDAASTLKETALKKAEDVGLRPTQHGALAAILDFRKGDVRWESFNAGEYTKQLPEIKAEFKKGSGADGFVEATGKILDKKAETFRPTIEKADAQKYLNPEQLYAEAEAILAKEVTNPETRAALLESFKSDFRNVKPDNLLQFAREKNKDLVNYYKSKDPAALADKVQSTKAIRDTFGNVIKRILKDEGVDPSVYSGYGKIAELQGEVAKKIGYAKYEKEVLTGSDIVERASDGLTAPTRAGVVQALKNIAAPVMGGAEKRLNNKINSLFEEGRSLAKDKQLAEFEKNQLLAKEAKEMQEKGIQKTLDETKNRSQLKKTQEDLKAEFERERAQRAAQQEAINEMNAREKALRDQIEIERFKKLLEEQAVKIEHPQYY